MTTYKSTNATIETMGNDLFRITLSNKKILLTARELEELRDVLSVVEFPMLKND